MDLTPHPDHRLPVAPAPALGWPLTPLRFLLTALLGVLLAGPALAQTTTPEGLVYTVSGGAATITGYTGTGGAVTIPATLGGVPVTRIGNAAFRAQTALTGVTFPASLTVIEPYAFFGCTSLGALTLPPGLQSLGTFAFGFCSALTSVTLPATVTTIVDGAPFVGAGSLISLTVDPANPNFRSTSDGALILTKDGTTVIQCAPGLTGTVRVPAGVTTIGPSAFDNCRNLSGVELPAGLRAIGGNAFASCVGVKTLVLPEGLTTIGDFAFVNCISLEHPRLPVSLTDLGRSAFQYCYRLGVVEIPAGITEIKPWTFYLAGLTRITLPPTLTGIGANAFQQCGSLQRILIPAGVTSIGEKAFEQSIQLATVVFAGNAPAAGAGLFGGTLVTRVLRAEGATGWGATFAGVPVETLTLPFIGTQPVSRAAVPGGTVTLSVAAAGATAYQWSRNGVAVPGATAASLTLANVQLAVAGRYQVALSNAAGTVLSAPAEVRLTGTLWAAGAELWGQFGNGLVFQRPAPLQVFQDVRAAAAGTSHSLFVKQDGSLWATGLNSSGQLGDGGTANRPVPIQVAVGVTAVAAGSAHSLFLKADGTLWAMGLNSSGQLGDNSTVLRLSPVQVATGVAALAAGNNHSLFLKLDGTLWAMGNNASGQLGDGTTTNRSLPVQVATDVKAVSAGANHSLFLKLDGSLWVLGLNTSGQLGDGGTASRSVPFQLATGVTAMAGGSTHSLFLKADGTAWAVGGNSSGQLGDGSQTDRSTPVQVATGVAAVAAGGTHSLQLRTNGTLWTVGGNNAGQLGDGSQTDRSTPVQVASGVAAAMAGNTHSLYRKTDGSLWAMGNAASGQLGDGTNVYRTSPVKVADGVAWAASGSAHLFQGRVDGSTWVVGDNGLSGRFGDGSTTRRVTAGQLAVDIVAASGGFTHSLLLKVDGRLFVAGLNSSGQLGDGTTTDRPSAVPIASDVVAVAAGGRHSLFLKADGTVWTMGLNSSGQLGDGTTTGRLSPVQVATGAVAIAAGNSHSLFLGADGTLWGMGSNSYGELGDGSFTDRAAPVAIASGVAAMAAGGGHTLILKRDGSVWAAGLNTSGQLGDGTYENRSTPVPVATGFVSVAAGRAHSVLLKADGVLWLTGDNSSGQLGDGTFTSRSSLAPGFNSGLQLVEVKGGATYFIQTAGAGTSPVITQGPQGGTYAPGAAVTLTAAASGSGPQDFRWQKDGVDVPGARDPVLHLPFFRSGNAGSYRVIVTNTAGSVVSTAVSLAVNEPANVARSLVNGSTRAEGGAAGTALQGSFTIEGTVAKQMLIRVVGPTLTAFGVSSALADPRLEVVHAGSGVVVAANDDWGNGVPAAEMMNAATRVGAFPLSAGSKDAAILASFSPGTYRIRVFGADATLGTCLLEIFDADTTPRLVQVATRVPVGGGAVLLQGWSVQSLPAGRNYLIRALGPALGQNGALADPVLTLRSGSTTLASNDNWAGDAAVAAAAVTVGAMPLPPASKDAALLFTPVPGGGGFAAEVTSAGAASGLALLEIHEVDASRLAAFAPAILSPPEPGAVALGQPIALGVVVTGKPAPTFQWRKDGLPLPGATQSSFTLAAAAATDAGGYDVVVTNALGTVTSPPAQVTVSGGAQATQALVGAGYVPGATITVTNTLTYPGTASSLGWRVTLPPGWSFASDAGAAGEVKPAAGATDLLEWAWTTVPASPVTFTYTVNVPAGETAPRALAASGIVRGGGTVVTVTATPSPLTVARRATHSADTDGDFRIGLLELTRVIELYNTRNGSNRTGAYAPSAVPTEDGFVLDAARAFSAVAALARHHSADSNRDGRIGLLELTRVIELYNYRAGTGRTGQYRVQAGTEDGFDPGP